MENVKNLIYHDNGKTFITIHNTFAEWGYFVKYRVLNEGTHGNIPHKRSRTFTATFSNYDMMSRFEFTDEIPLTVGVNDILDCSSKTTLFTTFSETSTTTRLIGKFPIKWGARIDDSGVAMKKYEISLTLKANMVVYRDRVSIIRNDFGIRIMVFRKRKMMTVMMCKENFEPSGFEVAHL